MTKSSRRSEGKKVSYAEVDSDVDMSEDEREASRAKAKQRTTNPDDEHDFGAPRGTSSRRSKEHRSSAPATHASAPAPEPVTYSSKLLLELPFDLFAEVCSHLPGPCLLEIAKVNKALRRLLLSRAARSIWSAHRRSRGFALFPGTTELEFALLNYANYCQVCGASVHQRNETSLSLRVHLCDSCREEHCISSKGLKASWPELRQQALRCVRAYEEEILHFWSAQHRNRYTYLVSDLVTVNNELAELEEEDETLRNQLEFGPPKSSSTRTRKRDVPELNVRADRVEKYIEEKMKWVQQEQAATKENLEVRRRLSEQARKEQEEKVARQVAARAVLTEMLTTQHGWTAEEVSLHYSSTQEAPLKSIDEDPEAWEEYHESIARLVAEQAKKEAAECALEQRRLAISEYYDSLQNDKSQWEVFPSLKTFLAFKTVRPLWETPDAEPVDDDSWNKAYTAIEGELASYEEKNRVDAIRRILAANQGLASISSLSKDSAQYPKSTFDKNFFSLATSAFMTTKRLGALRTVTLSPYPRVTTEGAYAGPGSLKARINVRQVHVVRAVAVAAGLDPDTATLEDLEDLEDKFRWTNAPTPYLAQDVSGWITLLERVSRHGPSNAEIIQGKEIKVAYSSSSISNEEEGYDDEEVDGDESSKDEKQSGDSNVKDEDESEQDE